MNRANVVVGSYDRAGETFQNDAESPRCDIKAARLEPDTIRVGHPETLILQVDVCDEVFAASSTRLEAVGETAKGIDWHMSRLVGQIEMSISVRNASQPLILSARRARRNPLKLPTHPDIPGFRMLQSLFARFQIRLRPAAD